MTQSYLTFKFLSRLKKSSMRYSKSNLTLMDSQTLSQKNFLFENTLGVSGDSELGGLDSSWAALI